MYFIIASDDGNDVAKIVLWALNVLFLVLTSAFLHILGTYVLPYNLWISDVCLCLIFRSEGIREFWRWIFIFQTSNGVIWIFYLTYKCLRVSFEETRETTDMEFQSANILKTMLRRRS